MEATHVSIMPPFDKIGVAFQPLGLNYFVDQPLGELMTNREDIRFDYFRKDILPVLDQVYTSKDITKKVQLLDQYFLQKLVDFSESRLKACFNLDSEKSTSFCRKY